MRLEMMVGFSQLIPSLIWGMKLLNPFALTWIPVWAVNLKMAIVLEYSQELADRDGLRRQCEMRKLRPGVAREWKRLQLWAKINKITMTHLHKLDFFGKFVRGEM